MVFKKHWMKYVGWKNCGYDFLQGSAWGRVALKASILKCLAIRTTTVVYKKCKSHVSPIHNKMTVMFLPMIGYIRCAGDPNLKVFIVN